MEIDTIIKEVKAKVESYARKSSTFGDFEQAVMSDKELISAVGRGTLNVLVQRNETAMLLN